MSLPIPPSLPRLLAVLSLACIACGESSSADLAALQGCYDQALEDQQDCSDECIDDQRSCNDRCGTDQTCVSNCGDDAQDCISDCADQSDDDRGWCETLYG